MTNKPFIITMLLFTISIIAVAKIESRNTPYVSITNLENIPIYIGHYIAVEDKFPQSVYDELNADINIFRHYKSPEGQQIDLYIGYYGTAKGGRTGHNPYACLPGAGWSIMEIKKIKIYFEYANRTEEIQCITTQKGDIYNVILHWYQSDGTKVLGSGLEQNINRFVGRIFHNRNDGAYIQLSTQCSYLYINKSQHELIKFAEQLLDLLPKYWPIEKTL
jgi:EpsI family protein